MSGQSIEKRGGGDRPRVDPSRIGGSVGEPVLPNREIDLPTVEFRYANMERDAEAIANIWGNEDVRGHLAGMAPHPSRTTHNIERYRKNYGKDIIIPVKEDIMAKFGNTNNSIIIAEDQMSKEIIGVVVVALPTGAGIRNPMVEKLAVVKKARRKGVASGLVRAATADIFTRKESNGEYSYSIASAGIIITPGDLDAPNVFIRQKYYVRHTAQENCVSWDNDLGKFVDRDTLNISRYISKDDVKIRKELEEYLPKKAPRNGSKIIN